MNTSTPPIEILIERVENYGKTTAELIKLIAIDKTSEVVSSLVTRLTLFCTDCPVCFCNKHWRFFVYW